MDELHPGEQSEPLRYQGPDEGAGTEAHRHAVLKGGKGYFRSTDRPQPEYTQKNALVNGLTPFHQQLADAMLLKPDITLRQLAAMFKYTEMWISQVRNTDMFKAYMAERRLQVETVVACSLTDELIALGHLATERLAEKVTVAQDPEFILDAFDKVMHRAGFAPNKGTATVQLNNVQNTFNISREQFAAAKGELIASHEKEVTAELPVINVQGERIDK